MAVNLKGTLLCSQEAGRQMIAQGRGGAIVNVASMAAHIPQPCSGAYSPSKAAVVILTQMMALEWARYGIRVNAVSPGSVMTSLFRSIHNTEESMAKRVQSIPMNRIAEPEEVATAVVYLACDESSFVTGHDLRVDGASSINNFYLLGLLA
jgi:NAD(P)-dependent dehydrogenase (short-subunit alcohol dehydrogenase family)